MAQEQVILQHVTKRFTTRTMGTVTAVDDFNLAIKEGAFRLRQDHYAAYDSWI